MLRRFFRSVLVPCAVVSGLSACGAESGPGSAGTAAQASGRIEVLNVVRTKRIDVTTYRLPAGGTPFDARREYPYGPNTFQNVYSNPHELNLVRTPSGEPGIVWQDRSDGTIRVSGFANGLTAMRSAKLESQEGQILAAATDDGMGYLYYLTIQGGDGIPNDRGRDIYLHKASILGLTVKVEKIDSSQQGLDLVTFAGAETNPASLTYSNGTLGLMLGGRMHKMADGLNHQHGVAVVFDAESLRVVKNLGQTSGHSFENALTVNAAGEFLGIDLGDNYPRGVHLHVFNQKELKSTVVYTFKTDHGPQAVSPAGKRYDVFPDASKGGRTRYKWSNDNRTYTELGGVIDAADGYTVVFASEHHDGRVLDNSRAAGFLNDARNIGLVQVRKSFANQWGQRNEVGDDLVLTKGKSESGGFYTFGGTWSPQRVAGVVWLTEYKDAARENVSRLKAVPVKGGRILLLWEKWSMSGYVDTYAMLVDQKGRRLGEPIELGQRVRLNRSGSPMVAGDQVLLAAGDRQAGRLEITVIQLKPDR